MNALSLLEEAAALKRPSGSRCSVGRLLQALDEPTRAELIEALESDVPASAIADALAKRGYEIGDQSIRRHRLGGPRHSCPA